MVQSHRTAWARVGIALVLAGLVAPAAGQQNAAPASDASPKDSAGGEPNADAAKDRQARAEKIRALIDGTLDVKVNPEDLFAVDLASADADEAVQKLLRELDRPKRRRGKQTPPDINDPLWQARAAFFALSDKKRARLLAAHRSRQEAAAAAALEAETLKKRLAARTRTRDDLVAFLAGTLPIEKDPRSLFRVQLLDWSPVTATGARAAFLSQEPATPPTLPANAPIAQQIERVESEIDGLRKQYLALPAEQREALVTAHRKRQETAAAEAEVAPAITAVITEAEEEAAKAAEEKAQALEASKRARTEGLRLLEGERARLLGVKEEQAKFEADLGERIKKAQQTREAGLGWARKVRELSAASVLDGDKANEADVLYDQVVDDLSATRRQLRAALDLLREDELGVPGPGEFVSLPEHMDDTSVRELRSTLAAQSTTLEQNEESFRWDHADALRDAMVDMNRARLSLLGLVHSYKRAELEGFGADGVRQAQREWDQIRLEVEYQLAALPRFVEKKRDELSTSPFPVLASLLKLIVLIFMFRWWRKRADSILEAVRTNWLSKRPQTPITRAVATLAWYAKQVRRPLEWLVFFSVLTGAIQDVAAAREIKYLWLIIMWTMVGGFVIRLLNAIAARQGSGKDTSALRFRSLRLVGITIVVLGLILALTEEAVGRGALYSWMWSVCWMLALPVIVLLIVWWRPTIFARAKARQNPTALIRWVVAHERGLVSLLAAALGGAYLLLDGIYRFFWQQASHLAVTRRMLAYLFRKEVEKQASEAAEDNRFSPISGDARAALGPDVSSPGLVGSHMAKRVKDLRDIVRSDKNVIIAIVGERGSGKSTLLRRIVDGVPPETRLHVDCEPGGFDNLLGQMATSLGLPAQSLGEDVLQKLKESPPTLVAIDNAHRLVRPLIGGLSDMDRLIEFARAVGGTIDWVITIGRPAWHYLRRARGDRAVFDEVVEVKPFDEEQIATLVEQRSAIAGIKPRFDKLTVPRQVDASQMTNEERTRRDFFRILWDYSDGNPAVALHCWRESLFTHSEDDEVYVRLFKTPASAPLDALAPTVYFVLRAIVQLELAREEDIVRCTDLRPAEVADALRSARTKGYIEWAGDRIQIAFPWYRALTRVLVRQHLLAA